jgi:Phosphotransferase enzyme family
VSSPSTSSPLPATVDELSAEWLTEALRLRFPSLVVDQLEFEQVIWGTATKVRVRATYSGLADDEPSPPAALCIKGGFDESTRDLGTTRAYRIEAGFYGELAPGLDLSIPRCWFAAADPERRQGVVVIDDLAEAGATFGDPTEPWPVDRVAAALEALAALHAGTPGTAADPPHWLPPHSIVRDVTPLLLSPERWEAHFADPRAPLVAGELADRERVLAAFGRMWELHETQSHCITHGDAHLGNTYISADGRPAFLDWQAVCRGPGLDDVAYFITGAVTPKDRRANERELLDHYLAALASNGARVSDSEEAWCNYRRYGLHGFLWAVTPAVMQPPQSVRAMAERHLIAISELGSLELLAG